MIQYQIQASIGRPVHVVHVLCVVPNKTGSTAINLDTLDFYYNNLYFSYIDNACRSQHDLDIEHTEYTVQSLVILSRYF